MQKLSSVLFLALALTFASLAGCGSESTEGDQSKEETTTTVNDQAETDASAADGERVENEEDASEDEDSDEGPGDPNTGDPVVEAGQGVIGTGIAPSDLVELRVEEPKLQILDVRTPEEVASGVIEGAKMVDINDADFVNKVAGQMDKGAPMVVYCGGGKRSAKAIDMLKENGYTMLYNLTGGIKAWTAEGNSLSK
ncbi:MAG: rhodanese-like domain-containing protein [Bacteroidota bacterium]